MKLERLRGHCNETPLQSILATKEGKRNKKSHFLRLRMSVCIYLRHLFSVSFGCNGVISILGSLTLRSAEGIRVN